MAVWAVIGLAFGARSAWGQSAQLQVIYVGNDVIDFSVAATYDPTKQTGRIRRDSQVFSTDLPAKGTNYYHDTGLNKGQTYNYYLEFATTTTNDTLVWVSQAGPIPVTCGDVRGTITRDTVWQDSIALKLTGFGALNANVQVAAGSKLTIQPGTIIQTASINTLLDVEGDLAAASSQFRGLTGGEAFTITGAGLSLRDCEFTNLTSIQLNSRSMSDFSGNRAAAPMSIYLQGLTNSLQCVNNQMAKAIFTVVKSPDANLTFAQNSLMALELNSRISSEPPLATPFRQNLVIVNNQMVGDPLASDPSQRPRLLLSGFDGQSLSIQGNSGKYSLSLSNFGNSQIIATNTNATRIIRSNRGITSLSLNSASYCQMTDNESSEGISVIQGAQNWIEGNRVVRTDGKRMGVGIQLGNLSSSNVVSSNYIAFFSYALSLEDLAQHNLLRDNALGTNGGVGLLLKGPVADNQILNHCFNKYNRVFINNNAAGLWPGSNIWSQVKTPGTNVIGGPFLGGNFWVDYGGEDIDGDGLGDIPFRFASPGGLGAQVDPAPLMPLLVVNTDTDEDDFDPGDGFVGDPSQPGRLYSLRAAIQEANATPARDHIQFRLATPRLAFKRPLPAILQPVVIEGMNLTSPARITLDGATAGTNAYGLELSGGDRSLIRNLVILSFSGCGLRIEATNAVVEGCVIGITEGGVAKGNGTGIQLYQTSGVLIGGTNASQRNYIAGNQGPGILTSYSASANHIQGNYIGTTLDGFRAQGNNHGIRIEGGVGSGGGDQIGGPRPELRNVICGNTNIGIIVIGFRGGATKCTIQGNYIGVGPDGQTPLGNGLTGIVIGNVDGNLIGGDVPGSGNVISGNGGDGISLSSFNAAANTAKNTIQGNWIGVDALGGSSIPNRNGVSIWSGVANQLIGNIISGNFGYGIAIFGPHSQSNSLLGNFIGCVPAPLTLALGNHSGGIYTEGDWTQIGDARLAGSGNRILYNHGNGVSITAGWANKLQANSIIDNDGVGISLGGVAIGSGGGGLSYLQNFPIFTSVTNTATSTTIDGKLNSLPNASYVLEFFSGDLARLATNGTFSLGTKSVRTDAIGNATFRFVFAGQPIRLQASATDMDGNTSQLFPPILEVNTTGDQPWVYPGKGWVDVNPNQPGNQITLRAALQEANAQLYPMFITFRIPGSGVPVIAPGYALPTITNAIVIDATTQPGTGQVELRGEQAGPSYQIDGLRIAHDNCEVRGLTIRGFMGNGISSAYGVTLRNTEVSSNGLWGLLASNTVTLQGWARFNTNGLNPVTFAYTDGIRITKGDLVGGDLTFVEVIGNYGDGIHLLGKDQDATLRNATIYGNTLIGLEGVCSVTLLGTNRINANGGHGIHALGRGVTAECLEASYNGGWGLYATNLVEFYTNGWGQFLRNGNPLGDGNEQGGLRIRGASLFANHVAFLTVIGNRGHGLQIQGNYSTALLENATISSNKFDGISAASQLKFAGTNFVNANGGNGISTGDHPVDVECLEASDNGGWGLLNNNGSVTIKGWGRFLRNGKDRNLYADQSRVGGVRANNYPFYLEPQAFLEVVGNRGYGLFVNDCVLYSAIIASNSVDGITAHGNLKFFGTNHVNSNGRHGVNNYGENTVIQCLEANDNGGWGLSCDSDSGTVIINQWGRFNQNGKGKTLLRQGGVFAQNGLSASAVQWLEASTNRGDGIHCGADTGMINAKVLNNKGVGVNIRGNLYLEDSTVSGNEGGNFLVTGTKKFTGTVTTSGQQTNVTSLLTPYGQTLTLSVPAQSGIIFSDFAIAESDFPSAPNLSGPTTLRLLQFTLKQVPFASPAVQVEISLPGAAPGNHYYRYGPTLAEPTNHWYLFDFDGTTGAVWQTNKIILYLVDGGRGDDDLAANGTIVFGPGGPALEAMPQLGNPQRLSTGQIQFLLDGAFGQNYQIEAATNLLDWTGILTTNVPGQAIEIIDPTAPAFPRRFYRALQLSP